MDRKRVEYSTPSLEVAELSSGKRATICHGRCRDRDSVDFIRWVFAFETLKARGESEAMCGVLLSSAQFRVAPVGSPRAKNQMRVGPAPVDVCQKR